MYKAKRNISRIPMQELFTKQDIPHILRNKMLGNSQNKNGLLWNRNHKV